MKKIYTSALLLFSMLLLFSCGGNSSNQEATATGFSEIEKQIKEKFGKDAYYTDIVITKNKQLGNMVSVTVTDNPESLKMGQWNLTQNSWNQTSEVSLEISKGSMAKDFMFQLNEKINLSIVGDLIEKSAKKLKEEKGLNNPTLTHAIIKFPKNGDISDMEYNISMEPENGGTTFRFRYSLEKELLKMDY